MNELDHLLVFTDACSKGHRLFGRVKYCPFCGVAVVQMEAVVEQVITPPSQPVVMKPQKHEPAAPTMQPTLQPEIKATAPEPAKPVQPPLPEPITASVPGLEQAAQPEPKQQHQIPQVPQPALDTLDTKPVPIGRGWLRILLIPLVLGLAGAIYFSLGESKEEKINKLLKQARECAATPDWRCTADVSAQVLQIDPGHIPARSLRGKALTGIQANDLVAQAQDCAARNNWECARQKSREALRKDPQNAEAARMKGRSEGEIQSKLRASSVPQTSPPAPRPDLAPVNSGLPRQEPSVQAAPQIDTRQIECKAMVKAGEKALASRSYDAAIDQAREAITALNNCPGAKELEETARRMKKKAIGDFRME